MNKNLTENAFVFDRSGPNGAGIMPLCVVKWRAIRRRRPFYLLSMKIWDGTAAIPP